MFEQRSKNGNYDRLDLISVATIHLSHIFPVYSSRLNFGPQVRVYTLLRDSQVSYCRNPLFEKQGNTYIGKFSISRHINITIIKTNSTSYKKRAL